MISADEMAQLMDDAPEVAEPELKLDELVALVAGASQMPGATLAEISIAGTAKLLFRFDAGVSVVDAEDVLEELRPTFAALIEFLEGSA